MTMTRRRNSINIYDYPEHLNPFRDDVDDDSEKFNTTGRRRSSFRAMFTGHKGKSKTSEDVNPSSQNTTSRFMTWTPKLLRRTFRRSSPSRTVSTLERTTPSSSQISFRSPNSRTSLPPSGSSHSSLHSSRSRSMLPPSSSPTHCLPTRPSPPNRPAQPNIRPQLLPSQSMSPQSTENTVNVDTTPVPPRRRSLCTASSPEKPAAGERPTEDEVKYLQQGAKPKKKRRAPLPPGPPPGKSPEVVLQVNSNQESEAPLTSSVTSSTTDEQTSQEQSVSPSPELQLTVQEPEIQHQDEKLESKLSENEEKGSSDNVEISPSKVYPPEEESRTLEEATNNGSDPQESNNSNKDETDAQQEKQNETEKHEITTKGENEGTEKEDSPINGIVDRNDSLENLKVDFNVVLHISEEDLRDEDSPIQHRNHSENDVNHNVEHTHANGIIKLKDGDTDISLHNGENGFNESGLSENEMKLNTVNKSQSPVKTPEPKPRKLLPTK